jgi:tetratricopeptide (TPR) repeat protein/4-amino-4-deoxy-L-arabinose transferase-like glycosyltransferase
MEQQHKNRKNYLWLALGCILGGMALRLSRLGDESISLDEIQVFRDLQNGMTLSVALREHRNLFVMWLIHWVVFHFIGSDEFLMRLPEAFEGVLAIAAVYRLGRTLFTRRIGLIGTFLLAISSFHLQFSVWARFYALNMLLAILTLHCIYRAMERDDWKPWLGFVLFTTLNTYNHLTGLFVLATQNVFAGVLIIQRAVLPRGRRWHQRARALLAKSIPLLLSNLLILGLILIGSSVLLRLANSFSIALFGIAPFNTYNFSRVSGVGGANSAGGFELSLPFLVNLLGDFVGGTGIIVWVYGLAFLLGLYFMLSTSRWKQLLLTGLWLGLPLALLRFVDVANRFKSRYVGFMLPLFLIVVAVGMDSLGTLVARYVGFVRRPQQLVWVNLGLTVLLFGGLGLGPLGEAFSLQFPDWRGLSQFFKVQALPGDVIIMLPYSVARATFTYYYKPVEENTEVIYAGFDFVKQLETRQIVRPVWWIVPFSDFDPEEWTHTGFSVYQLGGLTVLHKPEDMSSNEQVLDEAWLILKEYAARPRVEGVLGHNYNARNQAEVHSILASMYCAQNQQAQCDAHFQTAVDDFKEYQELRGRVFRTSSWHTYENLNRWALKLGRSGQLEALYRQWLKEWPDQPEPHRLLAEWYVIEGRLEEAVDEYKKAIELDIGGSGGHYMALAAVYEALGEMDQALTEYQRQVELGGRGQRRIEAGTALAAAHQRRGNTRMAIQVYEETLDLVPFEVTLHQKLGYLYLRTGYWSRAGELFRRATRINPTLGWPHLALGDLCRRQGLEDQASVEFRKAIEKEPFERKAYRHLADLFESRGNLEEAVRVYRLAAQNSPRFAWPHLELGDLYVRENRLQEAVAAYQEATRVEPWNQTAQASLRDVHWSLASSLAVLDVYTDHTPLIWWLGEAWVMPYPHDQDVLVGRSVLGVEGLIRPDQVHLHPFSTDQDTYLRFEVEDCPYDALQIGYGLADQVAGLSDGVRYTLQASADGGNSYTVLWDETVTDSVWLSQTLPLTAYWGEDVTFQLAVDALGDDGYDWLQTTVRLFPALGIWDLAANLDVVQVAATDTPLSWRLSSISPERGEEGSVARVDGDGRPAVTVPQVATTDVSLPWRSASIPPAGGKGSSGAWVDGDRRPLVTVSQAPVQGAAQDNQVQFHPFSNHQDTSITIAIADNPYSILRTAYALADEAVGRSDGVDYAIAVSADGGRTYVSLLQVEVSQNVWSTQALDLSAYLDQDLTVKLVSSSRGNENYDWLQVTLGLLSIGQAAGD